MHLKELDFIKSFGSALPIETKKLIEEKDFTYNLSNGLERDIILRIIKKIDNDTHIIGSQEQKSRWESEWSKTLEDFIKSKYSFKALVPKFFRKDLPLRFNQEFIISSNSNFELDFYEIIRDWLFRTYFKKYSCIHEFGCGSGFNLAALATIYPDKFLRGYDYSESSVALLNRIRDVYGFKMKAKNFDIRNPNWDIKLGPDSVVFTIGAIEQLAGNFGEFLDYLIWNKPELCIHIEPIIELYDKYNLIDYLAIKFHRKRGYTEGFLTQLRYMEQHKMAYIEKIKRLYFGSLYIEGYMIIIWRPL